MTEVRGGGSIGGGAGARGMRAGAVRRTLTVALREFTSTVLTKGFIIGILLTPVIVLVVAGAAMVMKYIKGPQVSGAIAVIDRSGAGVDELIVGRFTPEGLKADEAAAAEQIDQAMEGVDQISGATGGQGAMAKGMARQAAIDALRGLKEVRVEKLGAEASVEEAKKPVAEADVHAREQDPAAPLPRIALIVVPPETVLADEKGEYGGFEVYAAPKLDFQIRNRIADKVAGAIVDARIARDEAARGAGLTPERVRAMTREPEAVTKTMTKEGGEKQSSDVLEFMIPGAFMVLLLISVMTGGQYLLTTTIEEKGSRVMEVLLSAVSPMQLMVGKVLGQMCVGLVILGLYSGTGIAALIAFSLANQLNPVDLVLLVVFFFISFFLMACLLAAVGSAVTELREAQTLQTPIMMLMLVPWLLWMPISRAPNSIFSVILSFVPGINPFVMMIRLGGSEPIPAWQVIASILVGIGSVVFAAWISAKIFRVGVLMYGKPPDFRTLVRWVRMA